MKNKFPVILISITLFCFSCKKELKLPNTEMEKIYGTWTWVKTYSGWGGEDLTPQNTGNKIEVVYTNTGTCVSFLNDKLDSKSKFRIIERTSSSTQVKENYIQFGKDKFLKKLDYDRELSIGFHGNDSLFMADIGDDASAYIYVRKK